MMTLGSQVELTGLTGRIDLNGERVLLIGMNIDKGRYKVRLQSGGDITVKPECCDPVLERAPSTVAVPKFESIPTPALSRSAASIRHLDETARDAFAKIFGDKGIDLRVSLAGKGERDETHYTFLVDLDGNVAFEATITASEFATLYGFAKPPTFGSPKDSPSPFAVDGMRGRSKLDERLTVQLGYRVLHLALCKLPLDDDVWWHLYRSIENFYKQSSRWEDLIHLQHLAFKVSIVIPSLADNIKAVTSPSLRLATLEHSLAESFESLEKYAEAIDLYEEAATLLGPGELARIQILGNAGLACKRAGLYDKAEVLYHRAITGRRFDLEEHSNVLTNLAALYLGQMEGIQKQRPGEMLVNYEEHVLSVTLGTLLGVAGFSSPFGMARPSDVLKDNLCTAKAARRTLQQIASCDFDSLRRLILASLPAPSPRARFAWGTTRTARPMRSAARKTAASARRRRARAPASRASASR